jgi:hypothetical protein
MTLAEIAAVLARHGGMRASLKVHDGHDPSDCLIEIMPDEDAPIGEFAELIETLQRMIDLAQIKLFAERYGVRPEQLVPFLSREQ